MRCDCASNANSAASSALVLVVLQLWLLTATMNAWLGGDDSVVWPAFGVSVALLLLNLGLLRSLL